MADGVGGHRPDDRLAIAMPRAVRRHRCHDRDVAMTASSTAWSRSTPSAASRAPTAPASAPAEDEAVRPGRRLDGGGRPRGRARRDRQRHRSAARRGSALPEVWTGSHLDSVPQGGKFDGALGVVAALEAVERLGRQRAHAGRRRLPRRGDRLPGEPRATTGRCRAPSSSCTSSRAAGSLDAGAAARRRQRDRRLLPPHGDLRRRGRPRGHDADGRPRRRAREGGRVRPTRA